MCTIWRGVVGGYGLTTVVGIYVPYFVCLFFGFFPSLSPYLLTSLLNLLPQTVAGTLRANELNVCVCVCVCV